jgi:quinol monooxygenase YgiN
MNKTILEKGTAMIVSSTKISVIPENRKEFLQTLLSLIDRVRSEKGSISHNVYQDVEDENAFVIIEEWETQADLDNHLRSDRFGVLLGALSLSSETPEIRFNTLVQTAGIEALKAIRC